MLAVEPVSITAQTPLFLRKMNSNTHPIDSDDSRKVRLPSISTIASSLPQLTPLSKPVSPSELDRSSDVNKLKAAAEIFSSSKKLDVSPVTSPVLHQQQQKPQSEPQSQLQEKSTTPQDHQQSYQPHSAYSPTSTPSQPQQQPVFYSPVYQQHPFPSYTTIPPNQFQVPPPPFSQYQHPGVIPQPFYGHYAANSVPHQLKSRARRQSKNQERKIKPNLVCQRCGITDTPEWRKGPNGARTLCNACGLFHAKILKKEGPEAAARAVNGGKIRKKSVQRKSYSAVSDQIIQQFPYNAIPLPTPSFPQYQPQTQPQAFSPSMYYPQGPGSHIPLIHGHGVPQINYPTVFMVPGMSTPETSGREL